ncbi:uncharacterized protein HMPREF1541_09721 [Cyphellophora europaea CBS 101466]|uniref:Uncharacterized protein n=1 Tax=Cyphellophora europaea (strain CBS 101466) TaxID=1220924 RepID=W2S817_CYPE1|nr:uncharacterized protein HMPREF1541_09721 [Cyphellophora europaea CBS 101466]ETN44846.1 hypothetical protein HMPREF1541_09721 [Cyphellophora europaea CBS 101466]
MTSPADDDPLQQQDGESNSSVDVRKARSPTRSEAPNASTHSLPLRAASPSLASRTTTFASTLSRSSSPNGRLSMSLSRFGRTSIGSPLANPSENYDEIRTLIVRAFSPLVAICAADEADVLARSKGIKNDFATLVRPYGERITGKVVVRDSVGASRAWDDFGVHIAELGKLTRDAASPPTTNELDRLEELMEQAVEHQNAPEDDPVGASAFYRYYLSRVLQGHPISPHEAFLHPVCAVIVITSATPQPIDTLRNLYQQTAQGSRTLPPYANPEYLRYYVLVHDEDRDDFSKTSALFDQMKRHFGLHCHLLRLRSGTPTDTDEVEPLPSCEWLAPSDELSQQSQNTDLGDVDESHETLIFSADAAAIRACLRELVAQSVIPHMEQRIALWNEQVASRRKGISGRFMSISRRWGGFGGSGRNSATTGLTGSGSTGNYDAALGYYRQDTPEAILAKLAAFAFMLRDYKLAASTMELVRSDYNNDKAWKYAAGANEICCVASLLNPLTGTASAKFKLDTFDQMLDMSLHSYATRSRDYMLALRAMLLGLELLKVRGKAAAEIAAKYGIKAIELGLVTPGSIGHVLLSERIASCFGGQIGAGGTTSLGTRRRKAALWNVVAADEWMKLGMAAYANERLDEARELYADTKYGDSIAHFTELDGFMQQLQFTIRIKLGQGKRNRGLSGASEVMQQEVDDETVEDMGAHDLENKGHRRNLSLVTTGAVMEAGAPKSPVRLRSDPLTAAEDDFE